MENHKNIDSDYMEMKQKIIDKLGFEPKDYNEQSKSWTDVHEQDNIPNPFAVLTMEELLFMREHNYLLD